MKQSIKEYEQLLLDSHSTRKGATNAGAQGGLLQESCEALGQSVHHTGCWRYLLKRYFKEHNAGVASVQPLKNHLNLNINVSTGLIDDYPVDRRTAQSVSCGILVRARLGPVQRTSTQELGEEGSLSLFRQCYSRLSTSMSSLH